MGKPADFFAPGPRSRLGWIKRRARRLVHAFHVDRETAVTEAHSDYLAFVGRRPRRFTVIEGGRS